MIEPCKTRNASIFLQELPDLKVDPVDPKFQMKKICATHFTSKYLPGKPNNNITIYTTYSLQKGRIFKMMFLFQR